MRGPYGVLLHSPDLAARVAHTGTYVRFELDITEAQREIIICATAREIRQQYEFSAHARLARQAGVSEDVVNAIATGKAPEGMSRHRGVAGHSTCRNWRSNHRISDETFNAVCDHFGTQKTVEITGADRTLHAGGPESCRPLRLTCPPASSPKSPSQAESSIANPSFLRKQEPRKVSGTGTVAQPFSSLDSRFRGNDAICLEPLLRIPHYPCIGIRSQAMSTAADGLISALENNFTTIDLALQDLTDDEFHRIPAPDCNSVSWIAVAPLAGDRLLHPHAPAGPAPTVGRQRAGSSTSRDAVRRREPGPGLDAPDGVRLAAAVPHPCRWSTLRMCAPPCGSTCPA